jgi:hypothetical protein
MLRTIRVRVMNSLHAAARPARLALVLAVSMSLVFRVPEAIPQTAPTTQTAQGPNIWSIQLDGGLLKLHEASGTASIAGMRYSKHYTSHIQGGLLAGFAYKGTKVEAPAAGTESGESIELARTDAGMIPLMGFMQVDMTERFFLVPFVGIAAGYEWLSLHTVDHRTGQDSTLTYGNIAWQGYGGLGVRLTSRVRVNTELFYNGGSLERSVLDPNGDEWREAVHVNGVGARVGLDMVFE